jgi:putative endonuclease
MNRREQAHRFGLSAERRCAWLLRLKGYRVLSLRHDAGFGEIDILARKGRTLVVVEVKARRSMEACEHSITPDKQRRLIRAAQAILAAPGAISHIRFDVLWVAPRRWPQHIHHAWEA